MSWLEILVVQVVILNRALGSLMMRRLWLGARLVVLVRLCLALTPMAIGLPMWGRARALAARNFTTKLTLTKRKPAPFPRNWAASFRTSSLRALNTRTSRPTKCRTCPSKLSITHKYSTLVRLVLTGGR